MEKHKEILKWIFVNMNDQDLIQFVKETKMKIDGYRIEKLTVREVPKIKPNVLRKILSQSDVTMRNINRTIEKIDKLKNLRMMELEEIKANIKEESVKVEDAIASLISATDKEIQIKGFLLYDYIKAQEENSKEKESAVNEDQPSMGINPQELMVANKTIENLRKKLEEEHQKHEKNKEQWKDEKRDFQLSIKELQNKLTNKTDSERKSRDSESKLRESLMKKEVELEQARNEISDLQSEAQKLYEQIEELRKGLVDRANKKIVLIGDKRGGLQKGSSLDGTDIISLRSEEVEEALQTGLLETANELWILSYNVNWTTKRLLNQILPNQKKKVFETYNDFKKHLDNNYGV